MQNYQKQIISLTQKAQQKQLELEEILYIKELEEVKISDLKKPSYHQRVLIDSRLKQLVCSLKDYGFLGGVFIHDKTLNVIDGWYRAEIWQGLGYQTIPCYRIDCTDEQEKLLHLKLNIQVATFDLTDFGLTFPGLNLVEDFGFTAADLHTANQSPSRSEKTTKSSTNNSLMRFNTLLEAEQYQRLKAFKEQNALQNWADVIDMLLQSYEAR